MFKQIMDYLVIGLLAIGALTHVAKLVYLFFQPKVMEKMKFISTKNQDKNQLSLYYLLTIAACIYVINIKLSS